ncbi:MAG TPA: Gfo/Idh/MocA family oxidoreductase [Candidatus Hydrogenedentes bacterium]|nr:Gfo/Idh/MocA family oxidoreductase [Candidatus Hydrogenedentota bacterium]
MSMTDIPAMKIGIMSFAHMHAWSYAHALKGMTDVALTAIWDDNAKRGRAMAEQLGVPFVKDMNKFLAMDTQGVIVTSENVKHRAMVEAAAKAGKWVLCEKPLATTVADAKAMIAACRKAKVGLGTAFPCRYIPAIKAVRAQTASGALGDIYAMSCTNHGQFPGGWFAKTDLSGGGAVMDHTVHVIDLVRWMTGKEFTKVYCECGNVIHKGIGTDDTGSLHLEMEGGIIVSHIASWNRARTFPIWGDVTLEIVAEKGVVAVDAFNQKIGVYSDDVGKGFWAYWGGDSDQGLVRDFVDAVRERREPAITGEDGLRAVEVTVAAYASARSGKMVAI